MHETTFFEIGVIKTTKQPCVLLWPNISPASLPNDAVDFLLLFLIQFLFRVLLHQQLFSKGLEMLLKEGAEGPNDMERP
jgi:hypothetical protein